MNAIIALRANSIRFILILKRKKQKNLLETGARIDGTYLQGLLHNLESNGRTIEIIQPF